MLYKKNIGARQCRELKYMVALRVILTTNHERSFVSLASCVQLNFVTSSSEMTITK